MFKKILTAATSLTLFLGVGNVLADHDRNSRRDHAEFHNDVDDAHDQLHEDIDDFHSEAHRRGFRSRRDHRNFHRELGREHADFHRDAQDDHRDFHRNRGRRGGYFDYDRYMGYGSGRDRGCDRSRYDRGRRYRSASNDYDDDYDYIGSVRNRFPYNASPLGFGRGRTGSGVATDILLRMSGLR